MLGVMGSVAAPITMECDRQAEGPVLGATLAEQTSLSVGRGNHTFLGDAGSLSLAVYISEGNECGQGVAREHKGLPGAALHGTRHTGRLECVAKVRCSLPRAFAAPLLG